MRALISGITGFVGQYLAEHLLDQGDEVWGCSFDDRWGVGVSDRLRENARLLTWNLPQPMSESVLRDVHAFAPHCIYHLAAISVPTECGESEPSKLAISVNVEGTRAVLELARSLATGPRVLAISSAHVYAPVSADSPIVREDAPVGPLRAYGKTKLQAERLCQEAAAEGLDVLVVRAFQHAGPRQLPKFMLPEWAKQFAAPSQEPIHVLTLDSHIDLSDVRDVVRAYRLLVDCQGACGIYNVGSGVNVRSGDVFDYLADLTGRSKDAVVQLQPGHKQQPIADISRLVTDTAWRPEFALKQTIADTLAYWQSLGD